MSVSDYAPIVTATGVVAGALVTGLWAFLSGRKKASADIQGELNKGFQILLDAMNEQLAARDRTIDAMRADAGAAQQAAQEQHKVQRAELEAVRQDADDRAAECGNLLRKTEVEREVLRGKLDMWADFMLAHGLTPPGAKWTEGSGPAARLEPQYHYLPSRGVLDQTPEDS